jgi:bifunctional UDP-N-acetylglucosamine pyrophosphorylase / glucosamine-1-phosphate N-acetyltransferase
LVSGNKNLSAIILAAGLGKRMKSEIPKVLHQVCFKPILYYILKSVSALNLKNIFVVVGHKGEYVSEFLYSDFPDVIALRQETQLGTAHAVGVVKKYYDDLSDFCLILPGDIPMILPETLHAVISTATRRGHEASAALLTSIVENPFGYGRIVRGPAGDIVKIVEEKDASGEERLIKEINTSVYCFGKRILFEYLENIGSDNSQKEFYLTDIVENLVKNGQQVKGYTVKDSIEAEGINDRLQLAALEKEMQKKINRAHMLSGVTFKDPDTSFVSPETIIGNDTIIEPSCLIKGNTRIGQNCIIGPFAQIEDCTIGAGTKINKSVLQGSVIGSFNIIGPTSFVRPGTVTGDRVKIGACCEIKKARISDDSKVPHLSYIGDAQIGSGVNIGAGTITCNYDGFLKNKTIIEDGVFIGSDTMLVAPVKIGKGAITAAGSAIVEDVPGDCLAIERSRQANIESGAIKFREKKEKQKLRQNAQCEKNQII